MILAVLTDVEQQTICATIGRILQLHHARGAAVGAISGRRGWVRHGHTPDVARYPTTSLFIWIHTKELRERRSLP